MKPGILLINSNHGQEFGAIAVYLDNKGLEYEVISGDANVLEERLATGNFHLVASVLGADNEINLCELTDIRERHKNVYFLVLCSDEETEKALHYNQTCHPFVSVLYPFEEKVMDEKLTDITDRFLLDNKDKYITSMLPVMRLLPEGQKIDFPASKRIRQVNIGLFHGAGVGGIMTTLSLMLRKKKLNEETGKYDVSPMIFSLFEENYEVARSLVDGLTRAQAILMDSGSISDTIEAGELEQVIFDLAEKLQPMLLLKQQILLAGPIPEELKSSRIIYDRDYMLSVFNELLINAMKYSPAGGRIYMLFYPGNGSLRIFIIHHADVNEDGSTGIEPFHEQMIYESFFRINNVCHEGYDQEEYQAGIGLTVVKWLIERHFGKIRIFNMDNEDGETDVVTAIDLKIFS